MKQTLSLVIPAYNEEKNIKKTINETLAFLRVLKPRKWEIIVVDDGSIDATWQVLKKLTKLIPDLKIYQHRKNLGIGEAWKTLYKHAQYELIFTLPADGQIKAEELEKMLPLINQYDIVVGIRQERKDQILRLVFAQIYNFLIRLFFNLKINDINSVKLYERQTLEKIMPKSGSAFGEAEVLIRAQRMGFKIGQVGINHFPRLYGQQTGVNPQVILRTFADLLRFILAGTP